MTLAYPLLLLLPLVLIALAALRRQRSQSVLYPDLSILAKAPISWRLRARKPVLALLAILTAALLGIAAARPQRVTVAALPHERRNIMLAIDVSGSMRARDFRTSLGRIGRLEAVKRVLAQFIEARKDDRLGLVVFGTNAFLQAPLTVDHPLVEEMIQNLQVGMAGEDTAIGDGLGLSLKRIENIEGSSKAIILLTDGVNRTGQVNPLKAAMVARDLGITIHTVGIGSDDPVGASMSGLFSLHQSGQVEFDEETLKKIAELTGGVYFNAKSLEGLEQVYAAIDKLERTEKDEPEKKLFEEYFGYFAIAAALSYLCLLLAGRYLFRRIP